MNTPRIMTNPRIYVADIAPPRNGAWIDLTKIDDASHLYERAQEVIDGEEMVINAYEHVPASLVPTHGGLNAERLMAFVDLAREHSTGAANAYIDALDLVGMVNDHPPEEWARSFENAHIGTQDSLTEWAWIQAEQGYFGSAVADLMREQGEGYLNIDRLRRDLELDDGYEFVRENGDVHGFISPDLT